MLFTCRHRQVLCQCISYHFVGAVLLLLDEPVLALVYQVITRIDMACSLAVAFPVGFSAMQMTTRESS